MNEVDGGLFFLDIIW